VCCVSCVSCVSCVCSDRLLAQGDYLAISNPKFPLAGAWKDKRTLEYGPQTIVHVLPMAPSQVHTRVSIVQTHTHTPHAPHTGTWLAVRLTFLIFHFPGTGPCEFVHESLRADPDAHAVPSPQRRKGETPTNDLTL
jgi:hypothetical protein